MARTGAWAAGPDGGASSTIRMALVLPGAAALGAFEAGAVYEMLAGMENGAPLTLDLLAGTSAGSVVGATVARSLLTGTPYGPGLRRWSEISLDVLTGRYERPAEARQRRKPLDVALLSSEVLRELIGTLLVKGTEGVPFAPPFPPRRVILVVTLTSLDGLPGTSVAGDEFRYQEAVTFVLDRPGPEGTLPPEVWRRMGEVVQASAAYPGAFDPVMVDWERRLRLPGAVEVWENEELLAELNRRFPGLQARIRYCDGGLVDSQPLERAITALLHLEGACSDPEPHCLVFDPRRVFLLVEPDPPVTTLEEVSRGHPPGLLSTISRALRLFTLMATPYTARQRVLVGNARILRLLQFLSELAQRLRNGRRPAGTDGVQLLTECLTAMAAWDGEQGFLTLAADQPRSEDQPGLVPAAEFARAVQAFYAWLDDEERSEADLEFMKRVGAERLWRCQQPIRDTLRKLRAAYRGLWNLDPADPGRYQRMLVELHVTMAVSLGLNRPWVLLSQVAPENPGLALRGEEAIHFGGFFSRDFLLHDFEVGRYYAQQWLLDTLPEYTPSRPVEPPVPSTEGITWRHVVDNWWPLRRILARLLAATGWLRPGTSERALALVVGAGLTLSAGCSALWAITLCLSWMTGRPDLVEAQRLLATGGTLFPLFLCLFLVLLLPRGLYRELWRRWWRYLWHGPKA